MLNVFAIVVCLAATAFADRDPAVADGPATLEEPTP